MSQFEYKTFDEAIEAIEAAIKDVAADYPDLSYDDAAHDLTINLFMDCPPTVRHELARSYLGWDPEDDRDLYERHNIPRKIHGR